MSNILVLVLNGEVKVEYDRTKPLAGLQRRFLQKMDNDMDDGFLMDGEFVTTPTTKQRVQFVANHVVNAFLNDKDELIAAGCAYLAKALSELKQIRVTQDENGHTVDLVFNQELNNQVKVGMSPLLN